MFEAIYISPSYYEGDSENVSDEDLYEDDYTDNVSPDFSFKKEKNVRTHLP
jgi:hypothetical protein